ncbi:proteasome alpha subunit [Rhodococcus sp. AG1013]|uniref:proteasome subunit alpha n=1 Tax=Rhodococcus sp. AG1013 TaxID=2183996 RepID=UPI000E0B79EB|nr:proteasome subunit alpha [Rhodococcus sp. AG1013]RDI19976.1 proteasome alpha subunit [Rhodococcus sp. AG1013]
MTLPYYASAEQIMRDRSELARKGIARGRSVIVLTFADGVLFVAENPSTALHKVSELYDRLGFAAVGKYNEFENLRRAGIVHADMRGYSYDRRDVTGRSLANGYAQTLGTIFTEQPKPYEVEICVAEVGPQEAPPQAQLYRITYDGSIVDEQQFVVMGGTTEPIVTALRESYRTGMDLAEAVAVAVKALQDGTSSGNGDSDRRTLGVSSLEVAVLDQSRPRRTFRRISGSVLESLLPVPPAPQGDNGGPAAETSKKKPDAEGDAPGTGDTA